MLRTLVTILALAQTAHANSCSGLGSISVSRSCDEYNCFDGAHINGFDISCDTGFTKAQCADKCCSQSNCKGFDYSAIDQGWGAGRCCTSYVSRFDGAFEHNSGTYLSCEKNNVTCSSPPLPPSAYIPTPSDPITECWIDVLTESHNGNECFEEKCPPLHNKGGNWCKLHGMADKKVCCSNHRRCNRRCRHRCRHRCDVDYRVVLLLREMWLLQVPTQPTHHSRCCATTTTTASRVCPTGNARASRRVRVITNYHIKKDRV